MNTFIGNISLLILTVLLQSFLFDNMTLLLSLTLLPYIIFIALQPMQRSQLQMILLGFALGVAIDLAVGVAGVNTISTLAVSYLRVYILRLSVGKELISQGGLPIIGRVGAMRLFRYLLMIVTLHSLIYFAFESMNFASIGIIAIRFGISLAVTLLFAWIIVVLTSAKLHHYSD